MTILITGCTGSFGSALAKHLLANSSEKIRLLARSESRLADLQRELNDFTRTTFILADIRDYDRLLDAFRDVDTIYHAAALKTVPASYVHTSEFVKTNIEGTRNVARAATRCGVGKVLLISSDKACEPYNPYGVSKAMAEHIITEANMHVPYTTRLASVRGGNVWGSRGSVVERWTQEDVITVNDPDVTRFHLPMSYWLQFCITAAVNMHGGEVFTPKCKAWRLGTLALVFQSVSGKPIVLNGHREGDKLHESLISKHESANAADIEWANVIEPASSIRSVWNYQPHNGRLIGEVSSNRVKYMTADEMKSAIVGESK